MHEDFDIPVSVIPLLQNKIKRYLVLEESISKIMNWKKDSFVPESFLVVLSCLDIAIRQKEKELDECKKNIMDDERFEKLLGELKKEGEKE